MEKIAVVIVAGGSGVRMGAGVPKQFLPLAGVPVLVRTVAAFAGVLPGARIVVVLPAAEIDRWHALAAEHAPGVHIVCQGGATRFESVRRGLDAAGQCDIVMIHDGVRPMASQELIGRVLDTARRHGSAIPVVEAVDSFREMTAAGSVPVDRAKLRAVQTPQAFDRELICEAYLRAPHGGFTDDATVAEALGHSVALCEGERTNIKITSPPDMAFCEILIKSRPNYEEI